MENDKQTTRKQTTRETISYYDEHGEALERWTTPDARPERQTEKWLNGILRKT